MDAPAAIACNLNALSSAERGERERLARRVFARVTAVEELGDGWSFVLPPDAETLSDTAAFVALERRCCPFLRFRFDVASLDEPLRLSLTGGTGVKQFLAAQGVRAR